MIETATSKDYNDFWENDGISMVGNPFPSAMSDDTITFSSTTFGAAQSVPYDSFMGGQDHITFDTGTLNLNVPVENNNKYKYNEDNILEELKEYIDKTYDEHYSRNKFQATEFIIDGGHGEGFCIGNILKYAQRYGKKNGKDRKDLLKVIHYGIIALYINEMENLYNETK